MFHYQVLRDHVRSSWHWAVVRHWVIHRMGSYWDISGVLMSMDWFKGQIAGNPHIYWENLWFPIDFPLNQSIHNGIYWHITGMLWHITGITFDEYNQQ